MRSPEKAEDLQNIVDVECIKLDVTDPDSVREGIRSALDKFGDHAGEFQSFRVFRKEPKSKHGWQCYFWIVDLGLDRPREGAGFGAMSARALTTPAGRTGYGRFRRNRSDEPA